ncbi:MAG TPA: hypothetical protein VF473_09265 [Cyclobacteriaceae bacterium]
MSHKLDGYGIIQAKNRQPVVFLNTDPSLRYMNWVNKGLADTAKTVPVDAYFVKSDTARLRYKGSAWNVPINALIHYEFLERYRLGVGYSYEYMNIGRMHPKTFTDKLGAFQPTPRGGFMSKFYGMAGVSFYRIDKFLFTGDLQAGSFKPGKNFDMSQIRKGLYVNAGVTVEREFSEYLKAFIRPSFEFKNYTISLPGADKPIPHYMNAFYANVGLTYAIPDLPKCFHPECHSQMNHVHGDREYRSRMHRIWKKQNPLYGENNPKLLKYKGKNRKKMNPY